MHPPVTALSPQPALTGCRDQELRFTVHDSADYHQLKVSVFNDDKKTELIGETWVNLEAVIIPGGGQSDTWHGLNCRGKYAGEIRIELTYYDTRPKDEKAPSERRQPTARSGGSPAVGGPRESTPVKRRPLPSDPTGASPSPITTPEQRGLRGLQAGPRSYGSPRHEHSSSKSRSTQQADTPPRRPLPGASPMNETPPPPKQQTPQQQPPTSWPAEHDAYHTPPPNPRSSNSALQQYGETSFDMSYAAPKPYEVKPIDAHSANRAMSQDNLRASRRQSYNPPPELAHSYSAPAVPHAYELEPFQDSYHAEPVYSNHVEPAYSNQQSDMHERDAVQDQSYHVEPLRLSRNSRSQEQVATHGQFHSPNGYGDSPGPYDQYSLHGRRASAMQPTVEDEDDLPPPPPVHRKDANTLPQPQPQHQPQEYRGDAPAPLNTPRYREEPSQYGYDTSLQSYGANEYGQVVPQERRYTHPRPVSRPVSRDTMAPSPLRNETAMIPASLVPGLDTWHSRDLSTYQAPPPSYEQPSRTRQLSEPDYQNPPQYDAQSRPHPLAHHQSAIDFQEYYPHPPPEEPRRRSPVQDITPVRPRAISPSVSPGNAHSPAPDRSSRLPQRSMPTRKSVSPRPPPSDEKQERRLSAVPFDPDSFDVYNPNAKSTSSDPDRPGSSMEMNDQGQVVTFSGRVIDASDHLPIDSWAPEPERKSTEKVRPVRSRAALNGARDIEAAAQREERYRRERADRDRIRDAANMTFGAPANSPSNALVTSRHNFNEHNYNDHNSPVNAGALVLADRDATPPSSGRNRLQKRGNRPMSMSAYDSPPAHSPSSIPMPNTTVLRERENVGGYGSSPGYGGGRHSGAPPIPAKIPLEHGGEEMALSLELQSIDIGPGSAGRRTRGTTRRNYGF